MSGEDPTPEAIRVAVGVRPHYPPCRFPDDTCECGAAEDRLEIARAVDTAREQGRREGFERGASPSVQVLLSEVSKLEGSGAADYPQGVQDGLVHAVQTLIRADAARFQEAWEAGFRAGLAEGVKQGGTGAGAG